MLSEYLPPPSNPNAQFSFVKYSSLVYFLLIQLPLIKCFKAVSPENTFSNSHQVLTCSAKLLDLSYDRYRCSYTCDLPLDILPSYAVLNTLFPAFPTSGSSSHDSCCFAFNPQMNNMLLRY